MKKIFRVVGEALLALVFGVVIALFILEWWAGCGETYIDSKGVRHKHECLFIGEWK